MLVKEEIIVEQKTLDSFYDNKIQGKNTLLKIDVQGLEEKVLAGSSQILQKLGMYYWKLPLTQCMRVN